MYFNTAVDGFALRARVLKLGRVGSLPISYCSSGIPRLPPPSPLGNLQSVVLDKVFKVFTFSRDPEKVKNQTSLECTAYSEHQHTGCVPILDTRVLGLRTNKIPVSRNCKL